MTANDGGFRVKRDKQQRIALGIGILVSPLIAGLTAAYVKKRNDPHTLADCGKSGNQPSAKP